MYVEGVWEKGAEGEASGTGLDEGVGAGCLKAFCKQIQSTCKVNNTLGTLQNYKFE